MTATDLLGVAAPVLHPHLNAHFVLAIDGLVAVNFSKCTGLAGEVGVEEYAEGGENRFAHRFPSRGAWPNLVLSQGAGPGLGLWHWWSEYLTLGRVVPRDGQVLLMSAVEGVLVPVRAWAFRRAFPTKMSGPELDAQSPAVAVETLELAHHGLRLVTLRG